jgi:hypothetical protein
VQRLIRILHLLDATIRWDQRLALEQLLDRLPADRFEQHQVALGPRKGEAARIAAPFQTIPWRFPLDFLFVPSLRRFVEQHNIELIHAWGEPAVRAAVSAGQTHLPIIASVFDPARAEDHSKASRAALPETRWAAVCATEIVRRRLVEHGVVPAQAVLVRPGVDFATLNRAKKSDLRGRLGLGPEAVMLLTDQPATREGGQFCAFWATAVRSFLEPNVRLVVPGCTREGARLGRLARAVDMTDVLVLPGDACRFEELIAVADALLLPGTTEASVTAVAWAMGAGVPIIAAATRAVAELLAHDHNAFLIKPDVTKRLALRFAAALGERHGWRQPIEVARGQAYEVFSVRRYVEQVGRVYENLVAARPPDEDIKDPAIAGEAQTQSPRL